MNSPGNRISQILTGAIRRGLVGPDQRWVFESPPPYWTPLPVERISFYLHVPFCRNSCPYCPYTKVPYDEALLEPYTQAAIAEVDWWADKVGPAEITSIYIGGGTPTVALNCVAGVLRRVRERFHLTGDICIETNPADLSKEAVQQLHDGDIGLVSLGVQSFHPKHLAMLGRRYDPFVAERALALLTESDFASVNVDLMFALPGQKTSEVISDLTRAAQLGADQLTTYPLFTFPYTSVGEHLRLKAVRMPDLRLRRAHYRAIHGWCTQFGFERASVWSFKRSEATRYSSVTRDSYIGVGPGAGSHLPDGFVLNTFDLDSWLQAIRQGRSAIALRMPFTDRMSGWWWLYWRFYDTRVHLDSLKAALGKDGSKALRLLKTLELIRLAVRNDRGFEFTEAGAFWLHLVQNHFALNYVNTLWTEARREPWPQTVNI